MSATVTKSSVNDKYSVVKLERKFDTVTAEEIEKQLTDLISQGTTDIILDFTESNYLSSMGLRVLFSVSRTLAEAGKKLKLIHVGPTVMKVINIADCKDLFDMYGSEEEAVQ